MNRGHRCCRFAKYWKSSQDIVFAAVPKVRNKVKIMPLNSISRPSILNMREDRGGEVMYVQETVHS